MKKCPEHILKTLRFLSLKWGANLRCSRLLGSSRQLNCIFNEQSERKHWQNKIESLFLDLQNIS